MSPATVLPQTANGITFRSFRGGAAKLVQDSLASVKER